MKDYCAICKRRLTTEESNYGCTCENCKPVSRIVLTSAEEGVKYGIPGTGLTDLIIARNFERKRGKRATVLKALDRAIKVAERGPDMAHKVGCCYFMLSPDRVSKEPKFPKPLGQCCDEENCKINCGRKAK